MTDRAEQIVFVTLALGLFSVAYALVPAIYSRWRPESHAEALAHQFLGWVGRHFWHGWAIFMVASIGYASMVLLRDL
ncbi:MAG: hypothetical protein Q8L99_04600 [Polycyclovorans sp.]|nr:hypothetical protein [Polycyclovorans sp.]